jgi:hypothetical protein
MDGIIAGKDDHKDVKDPAAPAQGQGLQPEWREQPPIAGQRSNFDLVNSGYWDLTRQHHWAQYVRGPYEEFKAASFFFQSTAMIRGACNKAAMYVFEPVIAGGFPGMAVGAGVGGSLLAVESTLGRVVPLFNQPANLIRSSMNYGSQSVIAETAYAGAKAAAIDYGISMVADRCFGVNSTVAKTLAPNMLGTALETAGVLFCRNPKVGFAAGYIAGKICNGFRA